MHTFDMLILFHYHLSALIDRLSYVDYMSIPVSIAKDHFKKYDMFLFHMDFSSQSNWNLHSHRHIPTKNKSDLSSQYFYDEVFLLLVKSENHSRNNIYRHIVEL